MSEFQMPEIKTDPSLPPNQVQFRDSFSGKVLLAFDIVDPPTPDLPWEERWHQECFVPGPPVAIKDLNAKPYDCDDVGEACSVRGTCNTEGFCIAEYERYQAAPLCWEGDNA